ncbi:MAG: hypothetical protein KKC71_11720 [Chloroflexi bacterium]|nr:hypothetical protein [Chloroflexota bacterium]
MAKRGKKDQEKHDAVVRREANKLKREGWNVEADIPGFDKPKPIGKDQKVPDIRAIKAGAEKIIEVETPDTIEKDKDQQATFRRRAGQKQRTSFEVIETDD